MGIDQRESSPTVMEKIVYAGTASNSYASASQLLQKLADIAVDEKQVERLTRAIGDERLQERAAAVTAFQKLPLPEKFAVPKDVPPPEVAVVMTDGGRIQIMDRSGQGTAKPTELSATPTAIENAEWDESPSDLKGHWREDKIGLLMTMQSTASTQDPCPQVPKTFVDPIRIARLVRELKKNVKQTDGTESTGQEPEVVAPTLAADVAYEPPKVGTQHVVASRCKWPDLAPLLAQAAWQMGFQGAARKAFVGDGSTNNWVVQRRFFLRHSCRFWTLFMP